MTNEKRQAPTGTQGGTGAGSGSGSGGAAGTQGSAGAGSAGMQMPNMPGAGSGSGSAGMQMPNMPGMPGAGSAGMQGMPPGYGSAGMQGMPGAGFPAGQYPYYPQGGMQPGQYQSNLQVPQAQQQQGQVVSPSSQIPGMLPTEQSYIENILRLNKGKRATVYMTFENNERWNALIFKGIIEAAGRDHIILSDPETGRRYLLLMVYLDYVTFEEELNYNYPYGGGGGQTARYYPGS